MNIIPVIHSIDNLLNRYDELSKYHGDILSNFDRNFPDLENPLRDITRTEDEQQKTNTNILLVINENANKIESIKTIDDFHRRIIKNQYHHRPPNYSSNDISLIHRIPSRISSFQRTSKTMIKKSISLPIISTGKNNIVEPKVILQRHTRNTFTMKTVNRLSKPKIYHQLPEEKPIQRQLKPYENLKKETLECFTSSLKRTTTTPIKFSPKKLKVENKNPIEKFQYDFSRPLVFIKQAPIIRLSFPIEPQQKLPRIVVVPKIISTNKKDLLYIQKYTK